MSNFRAVLWTMIYYMLGIHDGFYPLWSRGFKYYHGYLMVFYLLLIFVTHNQTRYQLVLALFLTYALNVLVFVLPINIGFFHHRLFFWIYIPFFILFWLLWDIRKLRHFDSQELPFDQEEDTEG